MAFPINHNNRKPKTKPRAKKTNLNLLADLNSPEVITIHYNNTTTTLCRVAGEGGRVYYAGIPSCFNGGKCDYGLTLDEYGRFSGTAALNFIVTGGWRPGTKKPDAAAKEEARKAFVQAFFQSAIAQQDTNLNPNGLEELRKVIESVSGLDVEEGEMSEEDLRKVSLMDTPFYIVEVARKRGLRIVVDVAKYIATFVSTRYACVTNGEWDKESVEVSITSALSTNQTQLMREAGMKFRKIRKFAVKAASGD